MIGYYWVIVSTLILSSDYGYRNNTPFIFSILHIPLKEEELEVQTSVRLSCLHSDTFIYTFSKK